ncbi:MAG: hypothetical protein LBD55_02925 [Treponema sp.]|jgi:hypothetical protein|nr:hypothetical protein [Treponema sp.]
MEMRGGRKLFILWGMAGILGIGSGVFFSRDPVLIVTDASFTALYGARRARLKTVKASIQLFRPVKPVMVADNAGPDMVAFAVEQAGGSPYCILFPYRYNEGAERYVEQFPQVPVFILGGRNQNPRVNGTIFIETDSGTDLYRAGLCAGIMARNDGKEVLFFQNEAMAAEQQDAFQAGLREQGFEKTPKYLSVSQDYSDNQNVSCVVMNGQAALFLNKDLDTPVILFSWIDPDVTATPVKLVFDDSPWALVTRVVQMIPGKNPEGAVPSEIVFPGRRIRDKGILHDLKNVIYNNIPNI